MGGSSDLAGDPEKTKEPRRPADLRWKFYKDPSHGGGLRAALLDIYVCPLLWLKAPRWPGHYACDWPEVNLIVAERSQSVIEQGK